MVGVVRALDLATDWLVPYYRELLGFVRRSATTSSSQLVVYWRGHPDGGRVARRRAVSCLRRSRSARRSRTPPAWRGGSRLRGEPGVVCAFIGDGATSEGDFYEALNLAGRAARARSWSWCSTTAGRSPRRPRRQTAAAVVRGQGRRRRARRRARRRQRRARGARRRRRAHAACAAREGPIVLELVTYRMGAHTNSDDPTRYVPAEELAEWRARDPIEQFRAELAPRARGTTPTTQRAVDEVEERLERIVDAALARPVDPAAALDHVVADRHAAARSAQRDAIARRGAPPTRGAASAGRRSTSDGPGRRTTSAEVCRGGREHARRHPRHAADEMARDERVVLLGEDVGRNGGVFRATDGAARPLRRPARVRHADLRVGDRRRVASGSRCAGFVPVAEIQFAGFTTQAYHQIVGPARPPPLPQPRPVPLPGHRAQRRTAAACARPSTTPTRWRRRTRTRPG